MTNPNSYKSIEVKRIKSPQTFQGHDNTFRATFVERDVQGKDLDWAFAPYTDIYAQFFAEDRHYVIIKEVHLKGMHSTTTAVPIGVIEETVKPIEIDRRLHKIARTEAQRYAKELDVSSLVDSTEFVEERLPRGGK